MPIVHGERLILSGGAHPVSASAVSRPGIVVNPLSLLKPSSSLNLKNRLSTMATTVASAVPFSSKLPQAIFAPLIPITSTIAVSIRLDGLA
ncbi:MAG: hypothetical protein K0Q59_772 [Paenibacillus sp.]|nr:hypothetical protein [Paenibacillus sp.]